MNSSHKKYYFSGNEMVIISVNGRTPNLFTLNSVSANELLHFIGSVIKYYSSRDKFKIVSH